MQICVGQSLLGSNEESQLCVSMVVANDPDKLWKMLETIFRFSIRSLISNGQLEQAEWQRKCSGIPPTKMLRGKGSTADGSKKMFTQLYHSLTLIENILTALSRLSNVAIASANKFSDMMPANGKQLTDNMIVILLYTELNPCPRIRVLWNFRIPSVHGFNSSGSHVGSLTPSPRFARSTSPSCSCFKSLCACWRKPRSISCTISDVSPVSHSSPGNAAFIAPARFLSATPSVILFFFPDWGKLISSSESKNSEAMPSLTSFAFCRAWAAPLNERLSL